MAEEKKEEEKKLTKRPSAKKRDIQHEKRRIANRAFKAQVGTAMRALENSIAQNEVAAIKQQLNAVNSLMDKGVKTGIFKLNKASRVKSKLSASLKPRT